MREEKEQRKCDVCFHPLHPIDHIYVRRGDWDEKVIGGYEPLRYCWNCWAKLSVFSKFLHVLENPENCGCESEELTDCPDGCECSGCTIAKVLNSLKLMVKDSDEVPPFMKGFGQHYG